MPVLKASGGSRLPDRRPQDLEACHASAGHGPVVGHGVLFDTQWPWDVHIIEAQDPSIHWLAQDPTARQWGSQDLATGKGQWPAGGLRDTGVALSILPGASRLGSSHGL